MKYLRMTQTSNSATMSQVPSPPLGVDLQIRIARSPKRQEQLPDMHRGDLNLRRQAIISAMMHMALSSQKGQGVSVDFPAGPRIVLTFPSHGNNSGEWAY